MDSLSDFLRNYDSKFSSIRRVYLAFKRDITRRVLAIELDDEMVQDAMAIILFPIPASQSSLESKATAVGDHIMVLNNLQLPDPLKDHNNQRLDQLDRLHSLMLVFMQDYLTKATAVYPPREHLCIPQMHSLVEGDLIFRGQSISPKFNLDNLRASEMKRLMKAFLMFELGCKIGKSLPRPLRRWKGRLPPMKVDVDICQAVQCIETYLCSLYGAIIGQVGDIWLPEVPSDSSEPGLLFPDSFYLDPDLVGPKLKLFYDADMKDLANFGFDMVPKFLRFDLTNPQDKREYTEPSRSNILWGVDWAEPFVQFPCPMADRLVQGSWDCTLLWARIYEQRAWVFFDDGRLYPSGADSIPGPHFPTAQFLENEHEAQAGMEFAKFAPSSPTAVSSNGAAADVHLEVSRAHTVFWIPLESQKNFRRQGYLTVNAYSERPPQTETFSTEQLPKLSARLGFGLRYTLHEPFQRAGLWQWQLFGSNV
ncbi:hypothetical protein F53441_1677 [Fusarium austroafricanum]|uniref:Uncharacterized protein n=1 Tax=Fusarium austroafricanum TaxID=2364996 RepID=A0A8H4PCY2_9HYPO|nr:hypothetical protein F53441_1677 [Fusarium austroafricanum]